jgi:hypothetical protein
MQGRGLWKTTAALVWLAMAGTFGHGQQAMVSDSSLERAPVSWIEAAAKNEASIIQNQGTTSACYRVRKVDAKGDTTREVIESRQGSVARLVERDGKPITAAEDAAERDRLQATLADPEGFLRHHKRDSTSRDNALELVRLMPTAMIYSYAPGQPQPKGAQNRQIVIDFHPNPTFHPPTMLADLLTGLAGRFWIDSKTQRLTRAEASVLHPVNFGWGIVGRIFPGGTIAFEQADAGGDRWVYSHLDQHLTVRELMVKTVAVNAEMNAWDFHVLPNPVSFQDAIRMLLAEKIPLR